MTADYPKVSPRNIRVIVHIADLDGQAVADVPVKQLSAWLDSLDTLTSSPMMKWTGGGAMVAAEIFRVALEAGEHMVVCLAATWISLYGTGLPPGFGLTLDDLQEAGGDKLTIAVTSDRRSWEYLLESRAGNQGGFRTVPDLDFDTVGNA
jgi:hypothetical protein